MLTWFFQFFAVFFFSSPQHKGLCW